MNIETKQFLEELKLKNEVLGVILFGSWARGNNRIDSDVDLVVILTSGYSRKIEIKNKQVFEIIYTTEQLALDYWINHKDDAASLWEVAVILYDKVGLIHKMKEKISAILNLGKKHLEIDQLAQFKFDAEDQIRYCEAISSSDPTTSNLILNNKIFMLTEIFFDIHQTWIPAPKQRLAIIREKDPELFLLLNDFHQETLLFKDKLLVAKKIVSAVFKNKI